jgi:hypothetical protein
MGVIQQLAEYFPQGRTEALSARVEILKPMSITGILLGCLGEVAGSAWSLAQTPDSSDPA